MPKTKTIKNALFAGLMLFGSAVPVQAAVKLNPLFTEHMVIQRGINTPVWGTADPGEKVTVTLGKNRVDGVAGADGKWLVKIPELFASTKPEVLIVKGTNELHVGDVLVGDVWLGSGQSNMNWAVKASSDAKRVQAASDAGKYKNIRLFQVAARASDQPLTSVSNQWTLASGESLSKFSAVLFYAGEELQNTYPDVPLGLINSSVGGTNAYSWVSNNVFQNDPNFAYAREWYQKELDRYPANKADYDSKMEKYKADVAALGSQKIPDTMHVPDEPMSATHIKRPCGLYNAMIAPLEPFAIRGVFWYQGESDAPHWLAKEYYNSMKSLVDGWRSDWAKADSTSTLTSFDFPFYFVQLANYNAGPDWDYPQIRESQLRLSRDLVNSGIAVTIDKGEPNDIHPRDKTIVGKRLARVALARAYEKQGIPYFGPIYKSMRVDGSTVKCFFDPGNYDKLKIPKNNPNLNNFTICDDTLNFVPADSATIDGKYVNVTSAKIKNPIAVRYAWENNPKDPINFYSTSDVPASPFRTDNFPLDPVKAQESK
jgi:sialate O-acetylesterase